MKIAQKFNTIMACNSIIKYPNHIEVGWVLTIH